METFGGILAAIIIAVLIAAIFYYGFNARGPWGSLWTFFLLLLLVVWAGSLWVRPVGLVFWGIAWVPLLFIGLAFALLIAAIPTYDTRIEEEISEEGALDETEIERRREADAAVAVSWVFWILVLTLIIVIVAGTIA